jgi:hypothetical protein
MQYILIPLISLAIMLAGVVGVYNFVPMDSLDFLTFNHQNIGTSLTTLNSSDTMSNFPTLYNANNLALNNGKIENSSTTINAITTLLNLSSVGTITTGTWNATAIAVNKGGTGTTTLALNQVLLGNTTSGFKVVSGFGTSGQFLTSNGAGAVPTWQTSSLNLTDAYAWTGLHSWTALTTFATSTIAELTVASSTFTILPRAFGTPTLGNQLTNKTYVDNSDLVTVFVYSANSTSTLSQLAYSSAGVSGNYADYTKMKEITMTNATGTVVVAFSLYSSNGTMTCYGQIWKNGVAVGTERSTNQPGVMYLESINFTIGDSIQLYLHKGTGDVCSSQFFSINGNVLPKMTWILE